MYIYVYICIYVYSVATLENPPNLTYMHPNSQNGNLQKIRAFPKWESQKNKSLSHLVHDGSLQIGSENGNLYFLQKVDSEL